MHATPVLVTSYILVKVPPDPIRREAKTMSQQEFVPPEQAQQPFVRDDADEAYAQYHWPAAAPAAGVPKDEPAASYDEPMLQSDYQSGYSAQDYAAIEDASFV